MYKSKIKILLLFLFVISFLFLNSEIMNASVVDVPVAHWDFNNQSEISAGLVKDKAGLHNGQNFNGVYVNGYSGGALKIIDPSSPSGSGIPGSGGGDGVVVNSLPEISQVTLTFRMKTDGSTNATEQVVVAQNREPTTDIIVAYKNGQIVVGFHNGSLIANLNTDQAWHYYVVTYDGSNAYLYVDGQVKGFSFSQSGVGKIAASNWVFGINTIIYETLTSPNTAVNKKVNEIAIDDFKIYNHIFSEAEVAYEMDNNQLCYADTWSCSEYTACSVNGMQTRTCNKTFECPLIVTPSPATSQSCTPLTPLCQADTWSCSDWSTCNSNNTQTRVCFKKYACNGGAASPAVSQSCVYSSPICTSWIYSNWGVCANGQQTRTIASSLPVNCTGGSPVLNQECNSNPVCSENNWVYTLTPSSCPSSGSQTKVWNKIGQCQGGITHDSSEIITCDYHAVTCTDFIYSSWGSCKENGVQERIILSSSPSGCTGGNPIINQSCQIETQKDNLDSNLKSSSNSYTFVDQERKLITKIDYSLSKRVVGNILLQVENNGEGWYVYPDDQKKYYLGRPADAFSIMRNLGLGIKHDELADYLNTKFPSRLSGKIMLDVEKNGEAYYINPKDSKGYFLSRPTDAFNIMRELGLGITNINIRKIDIGELN